MGVSEHSRYHLKRSQQKDSSFLGTLLGFPVCGRHDMSCFLATKGESRVGKRFLIARFMQTEV